MTKCKALTGSVVKGLKGKYIVGGHKYCKMLLGYLCNGGGKELGEGEYGSADTDGDNDVPSASRRAPDDRLYRETDTDVAFDGERHRQPDASVTPCVGQLMTDMRLVCYVQARRTCVNMHANRHGKHTVLNGGTIYTLPRQKYKHMRCVITQMTLNDLERLQVVIGHRR